MLFVGRIPIMAIDDCVPSIAGCCCSSARFLLAVNGCTIYVYMYIPIVIALFCPLTACCFFRPMQDLILSP